MAFQTLPNPPENLSNMLKWPSERQAKTEKKIQILLHGLEIQNRAAVPE